MFNKMNSFTEKMLLRSSFCRILYKIEPSSTLITDNCSKIFYLQRSR